MKVAKISLFTLIVTAILGLSNGIVWADPSAQALFTETQVGTSQWTYSYTLYNTSDLIADAGYDLYDFYLTVSPKATLSNIFAAPNWDSISDFQTFIEWFSTMPGEPPTGSDLAPGTSLSGFSFTSDKVLDASLIFSATLSNPNDPRNPVVLKGYTAAVPEPATFLLLAGGLVGFGIERRRRIFIRRSF